MDAHDRYRQHFNSGLSWFSSPSRRLAVLGAGQRVRRLLLAPYALLLQVAHPTVGRLAPDDIEASYQEWLGLGRLLGIRDDDLPTDWAGFRSYCDTMIRDRLVDNETVQTVLRTIRTPAPPPGWPRRLGWLWRLVRLPAGYVLTLTGADALPPELRQRVGVPWSASKQRQADALAAISRAITPILPRRARVSGPTYLRLRRKAIACDEFAPDSYLDHSSKPGGR